MNTKTFYESLDDILELPIGTIRGDERLRALPTWDSLAVVSFIANGHGHFGVVLDAEVVKQCESVDALRELVREYLTD